MKHTYRPNQAYANVKWTEESGRNALITYKSSQPICPSVSFPFSKEKYVPASGILPANLWSAGHSHSLLYQKCFQIIYICFFSIVNSGIKPRHFRIRNSGDINIRNFICLFPIRNAQPILLTFIIIVKIDVVIQSVIISGIFYFYLCLYLFLFCYQFFLLLQLPKSLPFLTSFCTASHS